MIFVATNQIYSKATDFTENASSIQAIKNLNSLMSPMSPSKSAPKPVDAFSNLLTNDR